MKRELRILFTAIMFYTRIPCPAWVDHDPDYINQATRYFPFIGWLVGGSSALLLYACYFFFSIDVAILLSMLWSIWLTGAFHEDGLADFCDGFGGGWTPSKILEIMKDSRIGTYGVLGLLLALGIKFFTLRDLALHDLPSALAILLMAHIVSRWSTLFLISFMNYAREDASAKAKPVAQKKGVFNLIFSLIWLLPVFWWLQSWTYLLVLLPLGLSLLLLARFFKKWLGGYTGDLLGATQQINELVIYLSALLIWNYF